jgi:chromosome segregation ATPase
MRTARKLAIVLLLLSTVAFAKRRDPLTEAETDQLRQTRLEPAKRMKLFGKFAEARLDNIDQLLNDPKDAQERPAKIHDLLEDFSSIVDEINDNLDMFQTDDKKLIDQEEKKEYRKGLKELISQEGKLRARLRTLQHDIDSNPKIKAESQAYIFPLQDADASLKSSLDIARQYLTEKEEEKPVKK